MDISFSTLEGEFSYLVHEWMVERKRRATGKKSESEERKQTNLEKINNNLFYPLQDKDYNEIKAGSGDEFKHKLRQINSSTALTLNAFTTLRKGDKLKIANWGDFLGYELEKKLNVLTNSRNPANIDLVIENDKNVIFIESKFVELFNKFINYPKIENVSRSYLDSNNYPDSNIYSNIKQFFNKCEYLDVNQLLKHTIAIYRDCKDNPEKYLNKKVILLNLCWEIRRANYKFEKLFFIQLKALKDLADFGYNFNKSLQKVFSEIGVDYEFVYMNYHDFIKEYSDIKEIDKDLYDYLVNRYLNFGKRKIDKKDELKLLFSNITKEFDKNEIIDFFNKKELIEIEYLYNVSEIVYQKELLEISDSILVLGSSYKKIPKGLENYGSVDFYYLNIFNHYNRFTIIYLKNNLELEKGYFRSKHRHKITKLLDPVPGPFFGQLIDYSVFK